MRRCLFVLRLNVQPALNGRPRADARPKSGELLSDAMQDAHRLVSLEIALAKQELREIVTTNLIAAACLAAAGIFAIFAVLVAVPVLVVVLVPWHWEAALVWAIAYLAIGGGLALYGRSRLSLRLPTRTIGP